MRHDKDSAVLLAEEEARLRRSLDDTDAELARAAAVFERLDIVDKQRAQAGAVPPDDLQVCCPCPCPLTS